MVAILALALSLQLAPQAEDAAFESHPLKMYPAEGSPAAKLRSPAWVAAGAYGFVSLGGGLASLIADQTKNTQRAAADNQSRATRAIAIGALLGLVPGLLFGQQARYEENDRTRASMPLLDLLGSLTLGIGYAVSHAAPPR